MKKIIVCALVLAGAAFFMPARSTLAAQFNINIGDDFFTPFAPMIQPGDTVVWTNTGAMPHTVTADDGSFDSGNMAPGAIFSHTFAQGSVVNYYCKLHSTAYSQGGRAMNAVLLISNEAPATSPSPSPSPTPSTSNPESMPLPPPVTDGGLTMPSGWETQQNLSDADKYPYPTGDLIDYLDTIYLIIGHTKVPFTNFAAFKGLGYSINNVFYADISDYYTAQTYTINSAKEAHPWSSWLVYKGTVYYSHESGMIAVPSWEIFTANGGTKTQILPMNQADIEVLNSSSGIPLLEANDSRLY